MDSRRLPRCKVGARTRNIGEGRDRLGYVLAFFAIYVIWGTTYLAIRIAVAEMPPLFAAGVRFFVGERCCSAGSGRAAEDAPSPVARLQAYSGQPCDSGGTWA